MEHLGILESSNEKCLNLAGWEVELNGDEQCQKVIQTQMIDKDTAEQISMAMELVFREDQLVKAYLLEEGQRQDRELLSSERGFRFIDVAPHPIYNLVATDNADSYLGGMPPADFAMPKFDFTAPFQYLGKLSKADPAFAWLPFDLHLAAPIYLNFYQLFIDYANPKHPEVVNLDELRETENPYDDLEPNSEVVYKRVSIQSTKSTNFEHGIGHTGVPNWIQYPNIPTCPKSNMTMRFLCQLHYENGIKTEWTNVHPKEKGFERYFDHLNFWGDGDLYIFFEPESKVMCFMIQNT